METRIIFLDLDYTLMKSDKSISDRTAQAIRKAQEKGVLVGFCTSRGPTSLPLSTNIIKADFKICNAGACTFLKDEIVHTAEISTEDANRLFENARHIFGQNVEMTADTINEIFWNKLNEDKSDNFAPDSIYNNFMNFHKPIMKACIQTTDFEKAQLLVEAMPELSFIPFSDIPWIKVAPTSSSKESAIEKLCQHLNIPLSQAAAFGDDFTDIGMLKTCGLGVAMGNAIPQVKEIADTVTASCDQDGVAIWIEENLL